MLFNVSVLVSNLTCLFVIYMNSDLPGIGMMLDPEPVPSNCLHISGKYRFAHSVITP